MKKRITALFLAILLIFVCSCNGKNIKSDDCLTVYFLDVGQADASLLLFPDGTTMLIDAGNRADGKNIADFIKRGGIDTLDYFVCTHPHEDHIGGAEDIFASLKVNTVCIPKIDKDFYEPTATYSRLLESIEDENCEAVYLTAGTLLLEKENYSIEALAPGKDSIYSDLNDYSIVLLIDYYTNTLLFTGDTEKASEQEILQTTKNIDTDILKVGHHGSRDSSIDEFLEKTTPQAAIVSCGKDNTYDHPHTEALERLEKIGAKVYRTDTVGTVVARLYDGGFNIETDNTIELDGNK